jgi:hypothetical protein
MEEGTNGTRQQQQQQQQLQNNHIMPLLDALSLAVFVEAQGQAKQNHLKYRPVKSPPVVKSPTTILPSPAPASHFSRFPDHKKSHVLPWCIVVFRVI